jgi:hypothetical protein
MLVSFDRATCAAVLVCNAAGCSGLLQSVFPLILYSLPVQM